MLHVSAVSSDSDILLTLPSVNLYGIAFSQSPSHGTPRVALTSFISSSATNKIHIIQANASASSKDDFRLLTTASHAFPPTKIGFEPVNPLTTTASHRGKGSGDAGSAGNSELLATTGDLLRIWELQEDWNAVPQTRRIGQQQNPWEDTGGIDENQPAWQMKERSKLSNVSPATLAQLDLTPRSPNHRLANSHHLLRSPGTRSHHHHSSHHPSTLHAPSGIFPPRPL